MCFRKMMFDNKTTLPSTAKHDTIVRSCIQPHPICFTNSIQKKVNRLDQQSLFLTLHNMFGGRWETQAWAISSLQGPISTPHSDIPIGSPIGPHIGGIQAVFRHLHEETPTLLFPKVVRTGAEDEKRPPNLSMVEWMHDDAVDAKSDFFYRNYIWEFPDGKGKPGNGKLGRNKAGGSQV